MKKVHNQLLPIYDCLHNWQFMQIFRLIFIINRYTHIKIVLRDNVDRAIIIYNKLLCVITLIAQMRGDKN